MDDHHPILLSALVCEDVLNSLSGRLTFYNVFRDLYATRLPALVTRLAIATTWLREAPTPATFAQRVVILSPNGQATVAEAAGEFRLGGDVVEHTHVNNFQAVVLPQPGRYQVEVWLDRQQAAAFPLVVVGPPADEGATTEEGGA